MRLLLAAALLLLSQASYAVICQLDTEGETGCQLSFSDAIGRIQCNNGGWNTADVNVQVRQCLTANCNDVENTDYSWGDDPNLAAQNSNFIYRFDYGSHQTGVTARLKITTVGTDDVTCEALD